MPLGQNQTVLLITPWAYTERKRVMIPRSAPLSPKPRGTVIGVASFSDSFSISWQSTLAACIRQLELWPKEEDKSCYYCDNEVAVVATIMMLLIKYPCMTFRILIATIRVVIIAKNIVLGLTVIFKGRRAAIVIVITMLCRCMQASVN